MRVLVTGCAGFIGSHLCERLLGLGHTVAGVDVFTSYYSRSIKEDNLSGFRAHPSFRFIEGDLVRMDLAQVLDGVDAVFHQAAQAGVRASWGSSFEEYTHHNILATQRLLEHAVRMRLHKFIYASSSSVYGDAPVLPCHEDVIPAPVSPYGVTKLAAEHLCLLYAKNYGLPVAALRYFTVYGPRQRPDMGFHRFFRAAYDGTPVTLYGDGYQTRDCTYCMDAVEANVRALNYQGPHQVFNIGGGSTVTVHEVLDIITRVSGRRLDIRREGLQKGDAQHTAADISRARAAIGFSPATPIAEGLCAMNEWFATHMAQRC